MIKGMAKLVNRMVLENKGKFEEERKYSIRKHHVYGITVKDKLYLDDEKNRYFHIYHSTGKAAVEWFVQKIMELNAEFAFIEKQLNQKCQEISHDGNILEILGIGENTLFRILAEMGGILRFDEVKEIQKISVILCVLYDTPRQSVEKRCSH